MRELRFRPQFHDLVRTGKKTATARTNSYGRKGTILQGPGVRLILTHDPVHIPVRDVVANHLNLEGFYGDSAEQEFINVWREIHGAYIPDTMIYFHRFRVLENRQDPTVDL